MKEPVKFGLILLIFCAISAGLLSIVNGFTAPIIAQAELEKALESYESIFGETADSFQECDEAKLQSIREKYKNVDKIFVAQKGGKIVGYGVNVKASGFGGDMINAIGILLDGDKIVGFRNISNQETQGFGSRITSEEYFPLYEGKSVAGPLELAVNPTEENQVPWLTGATVTSKAALEADNVVVEVYNEILKNEK
ncbi:FMN-binding protein [Peptoniphilus raoultii]|uniref:FMN-binding protein n=1 Tax=Peptoniphilus raoultii TaxID=1776387 RepID=UPI0008D8EB70|nr:FMN-binding protein [Peptoniphilus raoultii]